MYKHLDRHSFSKIQAKLFPIYFFLSASLSFVQLAIFFQTKGTVSLNKSDKLAVRLHCHHFRVHVPYQYPV